VVKYTIDTSFAVKGIVPPRRKKRDEILEEAISFGIEAKASGYDTIFLTIAEITQSELLTDDSLQHKIALSRGIVSHLLRDMVENE